MKRLIFIICAALALGCGAASAKGPKKGKAHGHDKPRTELVKQIGKAYKGRPARQKFAHAAPPAHGDIPIFVSAPSVGISINFGGVNFRYSNGHYYKPVGHGEYVVVAPPVGMVVPVIAGARPYRRGGVLYYASDGVLYTKVKHGRGTKFKVVGYL